VKRVKRQPSEAERARQRSIDREMLRRGMRTIGEALEERRRADSETLGERLFLYAVAHDADGNVALQLFGGRSALELTPAAAKRLAALLDPSRGAR